jgi:hypothetical protein
MIDRSWWIPAASYSLAMWEESGENPAIFCYLIGWGTFAMFRSRTTALIPNSARHDSACSNPSSTFSTRSIVPTASEN